jgi:hypothetical protein
MSEKASVPSFITEDLNSTLHAAIAAAAVITQTIFPSWWCLILKCAIMVVVDVEAVEGLFSANSRVKTPACGKVRVGKCDDARLAEAVLEAREGYSFVRRQQRTRLNGDVQIPEFGHDKKDAIPPPYSIFSPFPFPIDHRSPMTRD